MSSQIVHIHRTNNNSTFSNNNNKNSFGFDAFNFVPGQDNNIRWLSRPNQQIVREKYSNDIEKFRITFDVENFQPEQIKICIENYKLTVTGVYEERSEGRHMQKQFEKSFDIPINADIETMASYITPNHMLVIEIPLNPNVQQQQLTTQINHLNVNNNLNDQRRLSFSLNKFNTLNNQGLLSTSNNLSSLPPPGQPVRRTSITKTTTTTTSTGSTPLPPEAAELLRSANATNTGSHSYSTHMTERRPSNTGNQKIIINEPTPPSTKLTSTDLTNLPIEIPPELLTTGGTITIQKRKISVTKIADSNAVHSMSVPVTNKTHRHSIPSTATNVSPLPKITERRNSKTISTSSQRRTITLEEFLQNKTWNPSIIDGTNGKKILYMRLPIKSGTNANQIKIILNGYDLRVEIENNLSSNNSGLINEHNYRQITLFPTCKLEQLKTEFKNDGFLHIQVPIKLE